MEIQVNLCCRSVCAAAKLTLPNQNNHAHGYVNAVHTGNLDCDGMNCAICRGNQKRRQPSHSISHPLCDDGGGCSWLILANNWQNQIIVVVAVLQTHSFLFLLHFYFFFLTPNFHTLMAAAISNGGKPGIHKHHAPRQITKMYTFHKRCDD